MPEKVQKIINAWSCELNRHNVIFLNCDYTSIAPEKDDFVYLDPPYVGTTDMYFGGIDVEHLYNWLESLKCSYALSFDGDRGESNYMTSVPASLYNTHLFIENGNSTFKKVSEGKKEMVRESLYLQTKAENLWVSKDISNDISNICNGEILMSLEKKELEVCFKVNGDEIEKWYEIVKYENEEETEFSEPIFELWDIESIKKEMIKYLN